MRVLMRSIRSTTGISRISPGPFTGISRPSRKMTARSYSLRMRIAAASRMKTNATMAIVIGKA
jgi:hypothetical protein